MTTTSWLRQPWRSRLVMSLAVVGTIAGYGDRTLAQIAPDNTLGTENSVVTPVTPDSQIERIDGGATRGTNLLHSFEQFNIREGQAVFFSTPAGIERIFSRVTGGSPSEIFGTLGVLGADLFFLNPNGIIFCPNAQLNVSGSFLASTASGIKFDDGTLFSAKNPQSPPILQLNIPIGLQFEGNAGSIVNRSVSDLLEFRLKQGKNSSTVN